MPDPQDTASVAAHHPPNTDCLDQAGEFMLHSTPAGEFELWHRSHQDQLVRTPVRRDANGLFIERWGLNSRRYPDEADLRQGLLAKGLQDVTPFPAQQQPADDAIADYTMPAHMLERLNRLRHLDGGRGLSPWLGFSDDTEESRLNNGVKTTFDQLQKKLLRDSRSFFKAAPLPPRPRLPTLDPQAPMSERLLQLLNAAPGIAIGETHDSALSKKLLIDNLPLLAANGVTTLYMEHIPSELFHADLRHFHRTGLMSEPLKNHLDMLDRQFNPDPSKNYTFRKLLRAAQANRIEIIPIDSTASYWINQQNSSRSHAPESDSTGADRVAVMNFNAQRVIKQRKMASVDGLFTHQPRALR